MKRTSGWLFDLYAQGGQIVLWFVLENGERLRLVDTFAPSFFVSAAVQSSISRAFIESIGHIKGLEYRRITERRDFWTGQMHPLFEIQITNLDRFRQCVQALFRRWPGMTYFNCDIPPETHYCYETGLFSMAYCTLSHDGESLLSCQTVDDAMSINYEVPHLRQVELNGIGVRLHPRPHIDLLSLAYEGQTYEFQDGSPVDALESMNQVLSSIDPDVVWTEGGDSLLFPALFSLAAHFRFPLGLDREPGIERRIMLDGHSYQSYGRVLYTAPDYPLFGRWHIDRDNSFWGKETGLDGVIEVSRLSKMTNQRTARRSSGSGISSIQLALAYREFLIPWKKAQPEAWKSALTLLRTDRGGLVYQPLVGLYEDVYELDFVAMFPSIMAHHNVSPETVNCTCCSPSADVPEIGYTLCKKREGMISRAVSPLIKKRREYKRLMQQTDSPALRAMWDHRQNALKWLLVTCFGYLGYRNARFGRIEAHEATCAFSREKLLRAKEVCEAHGFEMLHAIVDCVWIRKPGATEGEINELLGAIRAATEIDIALEGHYYWIAFQRSRQNPDAPVPNRFFGCMVDGRSKYRGIECRRSDQAPFIREFQLELLNILAQSGSLAACRTRQNELIALTCDAQARLRDGEVVIEKLLLCRHLAMDSQKYYGPGMTAIAARQARRAGLTVHAGEPLWFLVISAKDRDKDSRIRLVQFLRPEDTYDRKYYMEQLRRAATTVLEPIFGEALNFLQGEQVIKKMRKNFGKQTVEFELEQMNWLEDSMEAYF